MKKALSFLTAVLISVQPIAAAAMPIVQAPEAISLSTFGQVEQVVQRKTVHRDVRVNKNTTVNRNVRKAPVVRNNTVVKKTTVVVRRPVRPWVRRPYYGAVVAGVALGTVIAVSTIPSPPSSELCWYWSNSSMTRGYWDYCVPR